MQRNNSEPEHESVKKPFQNPQGKLRLDASLIKILKRCSTKNDCSEWNEWRSNNLERRIFLEGADLRNLNLQKINFREACLTNSHLEGADLYRAHLEGAWLQTAYTDSTTSFWKVYVNRHTKKSIGTNMRGISLGSVRINSGTKQLLEYNIRRMNWEEWYEEGNDSYKILKKLFVQTFWKLSDYGMSSFRIIFAFILIAALFALLYYLYPQLLMINCIQGEFQSFIHSLYFSIVTMTTLGYGDIHANPLSWVGQIIIIIQVLMGYFILGALLTRLNILFTSGGPSSAFSIYNSKHFINDLP